MTKDNVYINRFVAQGSPDYILQEEDRYVITIKSPFGTHASFSAGVTQWREIKEKYGLKPRWAVWVSEEKTTKDGKKYNKLTEKEVEDEQDGKKKVLE